MLEVSLYGNTNNIEKVWQLILTFPHYLGYGSFNDKR